ncbi:MAG: HigA family addiction module antitoxin [Candidatus Sulfotelmatobacter sp.]
MASAHQTSFEPNAVPHPGETVLEYLEFQGWSQRDLARRTGLTPKTISEICSGKAPITPSTALVFEKAFQRPAHLWLNLQRHFDEAEARRREIARSSHWGEWVRHFPLKEMRRLNFSLPEGHSDTDVLLNFFGVSSPESWSSVWEASAVAYRQTRSFNAREESIAAWVRETEIVARGLDVDEFDEQRLLSFVDKLRQLTRRRVDEIMDPVQEICAAAGVAVVWVPELRNTGISGCARWLTEKKALVGLTLRYKTDDQFWFTFFHEIGHIVLHRNKRSFVVDNAAEDMSDRVVDPEMQQYESEASRFSADTLIPPSALGEFLRKKSFTNETIHDFAETIGVGPGIVVGRLQHDGILERHQGNALKQKLGWRFPDEK